MKVDNFNVRWYYPEDGITTECSVTVDGNVVGHGYVKRYHKDINNPETARKRSLTNALKDGNFEREERSKFFTAYRNLSPVNPKW